MRRLVRVLLLCACMLGLAACGGSSTAGTLTEVQYDARVSHLCLVSADAFREMHLTNTVAAYRHYATNIIRIEQHFDHTLAVLKPPASIAGAAQTYLKANEKVLADDRAAVAAAQVGDGKKLGQEISKANRDDLATFPSAKAAGARGCYV